MGCFKGSKYQTEAVSPEQEQLYKLMAGIVQGGAGAYQSKPMYSVGADPMMTSAADYIKRQMGYGGYQTPGMYTQAGQNVQMPQDPNAVNQQVSRDKLKAPWLR